MQQYDLQRVMYVYFYFLLYKLVWVYQIIFYHVDFTKCRE